MIYIIEAVIICFFVGGLYYGLGKRKAEYEAFVRKLNEEQEKQNKDYENRKLSERIYLE